LSAPPNKRISDLNHLHREIGDRFKQHQESLLNRQYVEAGLLFQVYEKGLLSHIKEEEEILLPLYRERVIPRKGGEPKIFTEENQEIDEWLKRLKLRLSRVTLVPYPKDIITLLDDEARYKMLMKHHILWEERVFYPELERVTSEEEKSCLCRLLTFSLDSFEDGASPERDNPSD
jgi:hemerythrin-like domain-containing protein